MLEKNAWGLLSIALTIVGYAPYFASIYKRTTKPHLFSWIVWAVVNIIAFLGPYSRGAGAGSWATGLTAIICCAIAVLSVFVGEKNISRSDWAALSMALTTIMFWCLAEDPLLALVLAILIDVLGCYPTIRKSYINPYEENVFTWGVNAFRSICSLIAIDRYSIVTSIFPVAMIVTNGGIAILLIWRRLVSGVHRQVR